MSIIKFSNEEYNLIMEVSKHEQYIDKLLYKARNTGELTVDELETIEDNLDICEETYCTNDLEEEYDESVNTWIIKLLSGEEILVELN